ncbi:MAG: HEAT repeat domain-containing protein [Bacillota bacterium]
MSGGVEQLLEQLAQAEERETRIELLKKLGEFTGSRVAQSVVHYIEHPDYLVRTRAFVTLGRVAHPSVVPRLLAFLEREEDEEFCLRCLEVFYRLEDQNTVSSLASFLTHRNPLLVRGLVWTIGSIGGAEAVQVLLDFCSSPAGRMVKPDLTAEAVGMALEKTPNPQELLEKICRGNRRAARYLRDLPLRGKKEARYYIYPTYDYFCLRADERGMNFREYRRIVSP